MGVTRIIFCGSLTASLICLKYLITQVKNKEIVGFIPHQTLPETHEDTVKRLHEFDIDEKDIKLCDISGLDSLEYDLGVSALFDMKISKPQLDKAEKGFINIHMGPLPLFQGSNSVLHALRLSDELGIKEFGISLIYMDETLDTGPIIEVMPVHMYNNDTSHTLYSRSMANVPILFIKYIQKLVDSEKCISCRSQEGRSLFFNRNKLNRKIDPDWSGRKIYDYVRAFTFPGKPRAFIMKDGFKFYLTLDENC